MSDFGPVLNEHFRLAAEIDRCVREHLHAEAAVAARAMITMAEAAYPVLVKLSTRGIKTSSGFVKFGRFSDFHAGYDYLTDKGYLRGLCSADEALNLCQQAQQQKWWRKHDAQAMKERMSFIRLHERLAANAKAIISQAPGIIQSDLLKQYPGISAETLYWAAERGEILRTTKGRSYELNVPIESTI